MSEEADNLDELARKIFSGPIAFLKSAPSLKFLADTLLYLNGRFYPLLQSSLQFRGPVDHKHDRY